MFQHYKDGWIEVDYVGWDYIGPYCNLLTIVYPTKVHLYEMNHLSCQAKR